MCTQKHTHTHSSPLFLEPSLTKYCRSRNSMLTALRHLRRDLLRTSLLVIEPLRLPPPPSDNPCLRFGRFSSWPRCLGIWTWWHTNNDRSLLALGIYDWASDSMTECPLEITSTLSNHYWPCDSMTERHLEITSSPSSHFWPRDSMNERPQEITPTLSKHFWPWGVYDWTSGSKTEHPSEITPSLTHYYWPWEPMAKRPLEMKVLWMNVLRRLHRH